MNKKVLKTMIVLAALFLCGLYVVKIFFPEQFIMVIENESLVSIGNYIDSNKWLYLTVAVCTNFITYSLYVCAATRKWRLNWKEFLAIVLTIAITQVVYEWDPTLASGLSIIAMFVLPAISNANLRDTAVVFSFNYLAQLLSTLIRSLPLLLTNVNFMTIFLMTIEQYFWLLLLYLYYNYKRREEHGKN